MSIDKLSAQSLLLELLIKTAIAILTLTFLFSCVTTDQSNSVLYGGEKWVVLPVKDNSGVASASLIAESLIEANLRSRGVSVIRTVNKSNSAKSQKLGSTNTVTETENNALKSATESGARYAITGTVSQWGRGQLNGRDSRVEIALSVYDVSSQTVLWRDEKKSIDRGSSTVSEVANKAIKKMIKGLNLVEGIDLKTDDGQRQAAISRSSNALRPSFNTNSFVSANGLRTVGIDTNSYAKTVKRELVGDSLAIFYGANPPVDELSQFDRLVLEPDNIDNEELSALTEHGAIAYAYLAVGEVGPTRDYAADIRREWILGKNEVWNSSVLDLSNPELIDFMMRRVDSLVKAGYSGLFLDTMDSYQIYAKTPEARSAQETAIGVFVERLTKRHPGIRLISNRGFEALSQTGPFLEAIAAESLFASWDNANQEYVDVPENDRQWLLGQLNEAKEQFGLDVISIEYLPPERREEARQVATSVADLGFTPWVSTPSLDYVGVGSMEVMPRKIIMLFDSRVSGQQDEATVHTLIAPVIEYYGYVPFYLDVAKQALPLGELKGQYAGIVTWASDEYSIPGLRAWYKKQIVSDIPVAIFGSPVVPLDSWMYNKMGVVANNAINADSLVTTYKSNIIGFEAEVPARMSSISLNVKSKSASNQVHLTLTDKHKTTADLVITGEWGGIAAHPVAANVNFDDSYYWITEPFGFLERALRLQKLPMPDVTSENGNRLWLAHIDGDALPSWAEVSERKLGAELIHEKILTRFNMPHTVSIVEAEMTSVTDYSDRRQRMFDVARRIFAMPTVELATHTYSHPFNWQDVEGYTGSGKYNMDVGDYQFSPEREIGGSARFINNNLAPANKKTEVMLWSGDAVPKESALAAAHNNGLINLNGGNTMISKALPSISRITAMARTVGPYVQAYAPIMNENVYTNEWRGPFDGFRRVIETFEMTDKPRRFKPLSIYYHFYAGTKRASLRSLEEIYEWSMKEDILPVYASTYARKVPHYRKAGVARYLDGSWKLSALGSIKSIRILDNNVWPKIEKGSGIVGVRALHDGMYLHTDGSNSVVFKTSNKPPTAAHLVSANGHVLAWQQSDSGLSFRIAGQVPVKLELSHAAQACTIRSNGTTVNGKRTTSDTTLFTFTTKDTGNAILNCQA